MVHLCNLGTPRYDQAKDIIILKEHCTFVRRNKFAKVVFRMMNLAASLDCNVVPRTTIGECMKDWITALTILNMS